MGYWLYSCTSCGTVRVDVHEGDDCDLAIFPKRDRKERRNDVESGKEPAPVQCDGFYKPLEKF